MAILKMTTFIPNTDDNGVSVNPTSYLQAQEAIALTGFSYGNFGYNAFSNGGQTLYGNGWTQWDHYINDTNLTTFVSNYNTAISKFAHTITQPHLIQIPINAVN